MKQVLLRIFGVWILVFSINGGVAQHSFVPGMLYVKTKKATAPDQLQSTYHSLVETYGVIAIEPAFPRLGMKAATVTEWEVLTGNEDAVAEALAAFPEIEYAERIPFVYNSYVPNDLDSSLQRYLAIIRAPDAWDISTGKKEVVIAIVDNGLMVNHSELMPNLWVNPDEIPGDSIDNDLNGYIDDIHGWDIGDWDNDPSPPSRSFRHGSHVAGCASAAADNGSGIASIGFSCSLMGVKIPSDTGLSDTYSFAAALQGVEYAITSGADIVNMSFGGVDNLNTGQLLMDIGHDLGVIFVAAAGNGPGDNNPATTDSTYEYPASFRHVISVGGTDNEDKKAGFSTYNDKIDVMAPGLGIWSTIPSNTLGSSYSFLSGSSQATPIVSGLLGLMLALNPCLSPDEAESILKAGCVHIDSLNPLYAGRLGAGRIDARASLEQITIMGVPAAGFTVWDSVSCLGGRVRVYYQGSSSLSCPDSWQWTCSNGQVSIAKDPVFVVDTAGIYTFTLMVQNAFGTDSSSQSVNIVFGEYPEVDAGMDWVISRGDTVQLQAAGTANSYQWSPPTGLFPGPNTPNPMANPDSTITYTLSGTSTEGCVKKDAVTITVLQPVGNELGQPEFPGTIHPPYPNPSREYVELSGTISQNGEMGIDLFDLKGAHKVSIYQGQVFSGSFSFRWTADKNIPPGLYVIRWEIGGMVFHQRLGMY